LNGYGMVKGIVLCSALSSGRSASSSRRRRRWSMPRVWSWRRCDTATRRRGPVLHRACACLAASQRPRPRRQRCRRQWRCTWRPCTAWRMRRSLSAKGRVSGRRVVLATWRGSGSDCAVQPWSEASFGAGAGAEGPKGSRFGTTSITRSPALPGASEGKEAPRSTGTIKKLRVPVVLF